MRAAKRSSEVMRRASLAVRRLVAVLALGFLAAASPLAPALAVQPDEVLADAKLEARARALSHGLRCLVCQNQSIDDSDAPLARDLRILVRERLTAGDTDEQVLEFLVARFGDFVLLKPPVNRSTMLLWMTPLVLLVGGIIFAARALRSQQVPASGAALSSDEERALTELMKTSKSPSQTTTDR
jgi:cytochrome c-type biogenesis protein CcmH